MSESKMEILSLALLGGALYFLATVMMDLSVADIATQLVRRGTDLLHRLLL